MLSLALFPGQGSQWVGMGKSLVKDFPYTRLFFEEAEDTLKLPLRRLCWQGSESELEITYHAQPALLTTSVGYHEVLSKESSWSAKYFAGHSLGEYSALVASKRLKFCEAVKLVHLRGQAMQQAVPAEKSAMAALLGCSYEPVLKLCQELNSQWQQSGKEEVVDVANWNASHQIVISGTPKAVSELIKVFKESSKKPIKAIPLKVSAPFHSSLMKKARELMSPHLENLALKPPSSESATYIIANVTGEIADPYTPQHLIDQIHSTVLWLRSLHSAATLGIEQALEVGDSQVLSRMWRKEPEAQNLSISSAQNIKDKLKELSQPSS